MTEWGHDAEGLWRSQESPVVFGILSAVEWQVWQSQFALFATDFAHLKYLTLLWSHCPMTYFAVWRSWTTARYPSMTALTVLNWGGRSEILQVRRGNYCILSFGGQVSSDSDDLLARKTAFCMPCNEGTDLPAIEVSFGHISLRFGWTTTGFGLLVTCLHTWCLIFAWLVFRAGKGVLVRLSWFLRIRWETPWVTIKELLNP